MNDKKLISCVNCLILIGDFKKNMKSILSIFVAAACSVTFNFNISESVDFELDLADSLLEQMGLNQFELGEWTIGDYSAFDSWISVISSITRIGDSLFSRLDGFSANAQFEIDHENRKILTSDIEIILIYE